MGRWLSGVIVVLALAGVVRADKPVAKPLDPLVRLLASSDDVALQRDVLRGMCEALAGRRSVAAPAGWSAAYTKLAASKDDEVRRKALVLAVLFGDPRALAALRKTAADAKADPAERRDALEALVDKRPADLPPLLRELLKDKALRGPALRGLAAYDEATTPALVLKMYATLNDAEKGDAMSTLASRPAYALALLEAVEKGQVARTDVSPFVARQLLALKDKRVEARLTKVWGAVRAPAKDKAALLARYKKLATPDGLKKANRANGRAVFAKHCASCHVVFGEGTKLGPDLTGSQRANPEYLLTKLLDPNAAVARDYQVTRVVTSGGRTVLGLVKEETDKTLTLQTQTEEIRVRLKDVEQRARLPQSMMPEGLLEAMKDAEVRELLAYLGGEGQVPLPKGKR